MTENNAHNSPNLPPELTFILKWVDSRNLPGSEQNETLVKARNQSIATRHFRSLFDAVQEGQGNKINIYASWMFDPVLDLALTAPESDLELLIASLTATLADRRGEESDSIALNRRNGMAVWQKYPEMSEICLKIPNDIHDPGYTYYYVQERTVQRVK